MSLVFEHVSYSYPDTATLAVDDVSFAAESGRVLGIIGHTGSGKSTMTRLMNALISPTSGRVLIDGKDINADIKSKREAKRQASLVFQYPDYQFFAEIVRKDISFGPMNLGLKQDEIDSRIADAMHAVGFDDDSILDACPFELSGGQKRRLALAEALVMQPSILILDEPMAGLDPRGRAALVRLLNRQRKNGITIILISHNMEDIAELSDDIVVMKDGAVFMQGNPREVFSHPSELRDINLGIPIETKFANSLAEAGIPIPQCILTFPELVDCITDAFGEKAVK